MVRRLADCSPGQWKGMKTVSGRMSRVTLAVTSTEPRRVLTDDRAAVDHLQARRRLRVELGDGRARHRVQRRHAAGHRARLVLGEDAAGGQEERVVLVGRLGRQLVLDRMEARLAGRRREGVEEQPRRAGVLGRRARPEDAALGVDLGVGDPRVVGRRAPGGAGQLVEHVFRRAVGEVAALAEALGQADQDADVRGDADRRRHGALAADDAAFEVGHRAVFLRPLRRREDDVGHAGRLGQEEVGDGEEVERREPRFHLVRRRRRDQRVEAHDEQGADAAVGAAALEQLVGRLARSGERVGRDAPHAGDGAARRRIADRAIAGQLVGLLAVLAAALAVALAGEDAEAAALGAGEAAGERDVDVGERVGHALRLLLGAAPGQHEAAGGRAEEPRRFDDLLLRHAGDALDELRPVAGGDGADLGEALGAPLDVGLVRQAVAQQHVQQPVGERRVGARHRLQVQRRQLRGGRPARIDHDERAAARLLRLEVAHERRHRLGRVAAGEEDDVGVLEILEREGEPAVEPEGLVRRRRARRHAVAAVVVDVGGADGDAGELAEEVGLLVGQRAAAEDADGIGAVRADRVADAEGDAIEGVAPADGHQAAGPIAGQRLTQPLGMVDDRGGVPPLGAQRAGVDREGAVADHRQRR